MGSSHEVSFSERIFDANTRFPSPFSFAGVLVHVSSSYPKDPQIHAIQSHQISVPITKLGRGTLTTLTKTRTLDAKVGEEEIEAKCGGDRPLAFSLEPLVQETHF